MRWVPVGDEASKLGAYVDPLDPPVGRRTLERCSCHDILVRLGHLALKLGLMSICDPGVARRTLGSGCLSHYVIMCYVLY